MHYVNRLGDYGYIALTVALVVVGQLILKWRMAQLGPLPTDFSQKVTHLVCAMFDPLVLVAATCAFVAGLSWMGALTRFELSFAYPFMSLSFVLVLVLSGWLLGDHVTSSRITGVALIIVGLIVASHG